jgi:TctA family transporter
MNEVMFTTGRDAYLIGIPLILLMLIGLFRLDEIFSKPKKTLKRRRPSCQMDENGEPVLSDPDGQLSRAHSPTGNQIGPRR